MGNTIIPPHLHYTPSISSTSRSLKRVTVGDGSSDHSTSSKFVKCVTVGDAQVGKTCMLLRFTRDEFPNDYIPTIFDKYRVTVTFEGTDLNLSLLDVAGQEDYDRPWSYSKTDFFVIAFSLVNCASYVNVQTKWFPELQNYAPEVPIVLVGTKLDLREDEHYLDDHSELVPVTTAQGKELCKQIGAAYYIECSSKTKEVVCFPRGKRENSRYGSKKKKKKSSGILGLNERESVILISHPHLLSVRNTSQASKNEDFDDVAQWPIPIEEHFIRLLHKEVQKGQQTSKMDEERWVAIDSALFSKFGKRFTVPKLKLKYNCLRKLHYDFAKLLAHTGMDWDPLTNKVHASEDIWESYIKRNPSAESFRKKGSYHHFHVLTEIFNDTFATGQTYCSSSTPCLHSDNKIVLEAHMSPTSSSAETFIGGQGDTNKQRCCPVIFPADISMRTESRTSSLSKLDDVFEALTESVSARLEASLKVNCLKEQEASSSASSFRELASIEDCMDILEAIDGLEDVAYVRACEKFTSCDWRRMFVKMSEARKRMWLGSLK